MRFAISIALLLVTIGCVQRKITVVSNPPDALVTLNGQEIGRTPVTHEFIYYGDFDVELRKDGYETVKTSRWVVAPIWQWIPIDLFADLAPMQLTDHQYMGFTLKAASEDAADPNEMLARATQLRGKLESSENTRKPITNPATKPASTKKPGP